MWPRMWLLSDAFAEFEEERRPGQTRKRHCQLVHVLHSCLQSVKAWSCLEGDLAFDKRPYAPIHLPFLSVRLFSPSHFWVQWLSVMHPGLSTHPTPAPWQPKKHWPTSILSEKPAKVIVPSVSCSLTTCVMRCEGTPDCREPLLGTEAGRARSTFALLQLRGDGVGHFWLEHVFLAGDDVLHQAVRRFVDVDVFLRQREGWRRCTRHTIFYVHSNITELFLTRCTK